MTSSIFENWFHYSFVPEVRKFLRKKKLEQKAMLLLDNAPSHPPSYNLISDDGKIFVEYMPPNVTAWIQPMDQNVIKLTKLFYRNSLLSYLVSFEQQNTLYEAIKAFSLKDTVTLLSTAWNKVEKETIAKCWKHILSVPDDNSDSEEDMPLNILQQRLKNSIERNITQGTIELLEVINPNPTYSREDIVNWNKEDIDYVSGTDNEIEEDEEEQNVKITTAEAINSVNNVILWAEINSISYQNILPLIQIREMATRILLQENKHQKTIKEYFTPT
jgi:hypothetical protein